jgi:hypothetical protein
MVCIETNMGIMPQFFFPKESGKDYDVSPYLERLKPHLKDATIVSGVSHPGVTGAHAAERCFLTGTPHPERGGFRNWVSLDQCARKTRSGAERTRRDCCRAQMTVNIPAHENHSNLCASG